MVLPKSELPIELAADRFIEVKCFTEGSLFQDFVITQTFSVTGG